MTPLEIRTKWLEILEQTESEIQTHVEKHPPTNVEDEQLIYENIVHTKEKYGLDFRMVQGHVIIDDNPDNQPLQIPGFNTIYISQDPKLKLTQKLTQRLNDIIISTKPLNVRGYMPMPLMTVKMPPIKPCLNCGAPKRHRNDYCSAQCCKEYRTKRK